MRKALREGLLSGLAVFAVSAMSILYTGHTSKQALKSQLGEFQSGCAGIRDSADREIGAACVEMDLASFRERLAGVARAERLGLAMAFLLSLGICFAVYRILQKRSAVDASLKLLRLDLENRNRALAESTDRLLEAQKKASLGDWIFTPSTGYVDGSEEFHRIHGRYPSLKPFPVRELQEMAHPEDRVRLNEAFVGALEKGEVGEIKYRKIMADGTFRYIFVKATPLDPDQEYLLNTLLDSGDHLFTLINDILDFSKIESGRMEMERIPFLFKRLCMSVVAILSEKTEGRGVELITHFGVNDTEPFLGDPGRIRQILFNLLGNAVKFTEKGHVKLTVQPVPEMEGWISICIEDTGIGIAPEKLANLFQPFTQADASISRKFGGTGLGLAITFKLVNLMQGTMSVASEPGHGSRFTVRLPLIKETSHANAAPETAGEIPIPSLTGLRALLVDDRESTRTLIGRQLEELGMKVFEAASAAEARALLIKMHEDNEPPHIGILDWITPIEDGVELGRSIRAGSLSNNLPLILFSYAATRGDGDHAQVVTAGGEGDLKKAG